MIRTAISPRLATRTFENMRRGTLPAQLRGRATAHLLPRLKVGAAALLGGADRVDRVVAERQVQRRVVGLERTDDRRSRLRRIARLRPVHPVDGVARRADG